MNIFDTARQMPLSRLATCIMMISATLFASVLALESPMQAKAAEARLEPGIVYVQHRFADETGVRETPLHRAYATYTGDKQSYTARVNASGGAVDIEGRWKAEADGTDITGECSYDPDAGLIVIPRSHLSTPVTVTAYLDAEQSAKTFEANVSVVTGDEPGRSNTMRLATTAGNMRLSVPVSGSVKAVTQDSRVLATSEYSVADGELVIEGRTALTGSITVYLEGYAPEIIDRNPIKDYNDTIIQRSLRSIPLASTPSLMSVMSGSSFSGSGWIYSTNPGGGDWDYTDYVLKWWGGTFYLNCCQHGVYHMPESDGGSKAFSATFTGSTFVRSYDTTDATTIYHHNVYRDNYYVYVDAGWYQDVDGNWSEERETVTTSPRYGGIDLTKVSANPSITDGNGSYSTSGAVYGVYSDAACSYQLNSMTTSSGSKASLWGFVAGASVYVKETKPSPGYDLDPTVYGVAIVADQYAHVNGGTVREPPKTATVRFYADGDLVHFVTRPLGTSLATGDPDVRKANGLAAKPNCTPGLDAWYYDSGYSSSFAGKTLDGDLNLYARNVATVTYAPAAGSPLAEDLPIRKAMSDSSPVLDVARDVLPPSRQVDWGRKITLKEPRLKTLYHDDGERWRTLRWRDDGWYLNSAATGSAAKTLEVLRDTTVYGDWSRSTFDGIYSW